MESKKYYTVGTVQKSNRKIVEKSKIDITYTQIHDHLSSRRGTDTSIKSSGVNLVLWAQNRVNRHPIKRTEINHNRRPGTTCFSTLGIIRQRIHKSEELNLNKP